MPQCQYMIEGTRCLRREYPYCYRHKPSEYIDKTNQFCCVCSKKNRHRKNLILDCEHKICLSCFAKNVLEVQFSEGFTKNDPVFCPSCCVEVSRYYWNVVMEYLLENKKIMPEFIFPNTHQNNYNIVYIKYKELPTFVLSDTIQLHEFVEYI